MMRRRAFAAVAKSVIIKMSAYDKSNSHQQKHNIVLHIKLF